MIDEGTRTGDQSKIMEGRTLLAAAVRGLADMPRVVNSH
jgi:hypothetical protein